MHFDPSQYETVKARKARFYADHPNGRIIVDIVNDDLDEKAVVKAFIYIGDGTIAKSTGHALEIRDKEQKISRDGKKYESVNYTSWLENAEESAVGRALDNAGYASNMRCSLDEMEKAKRMSQLPAPKPNVQSNLGTSIDPSGGDKSNDGHYRITFGKHKQKTLEEVGVKDLQGYIIWLESQAEAENKPVRPQVKEFIEHAENFIATWENNDIPF